MILIDLLLFHFGVLGRRGKAGGGIVKEIGRNWVWDGIERDRLLVSNVCVCVYEPVWDVDSWWNAGTIHASPAESLLHASVSSSSTRKMHFPEKHCPAPLPRPSWLISCIRSIRLGEKRKEKASIWVISWMINLLALNSFFPFPPFQQLRTFFYWVG